MNKLIFKAGKKYTFSDYFDLNNPPEEIAAAFNYTLTTKPLDFPVVSVDTTDIKALQTMFYEVLPKVTLNSEVAKRDFLIAPVLSGIIRHVEARINVEYPLDVDDKLSGSLDYLIESKQNMIVIEAKKGDLDKGFNQLVAEMIALDKHQQDTAQARVYGAVSIGELWRFGILERTEKLLIRDLHTYRIPEDVEKIFSVIISILKNIKA